ncbi:MAG TPA: hypothetical protein VFZ36_07090 [Vicinamibacterales bacterium]
MSIIRVALLGMKSRLRDILTDAISREPDMELMPYPFDPHVDSTGAAPDALVCEVGDPLDPALADCLLRSFPRARALMVSGAGDRAALYELRPAHRVMVDVSIEQAIDALRAGLEPGTGG